MYGNNCFKDNGAEPFVACVNGCARANGNFRTAFWTGEHLQMTLMCIPVRCDIGLEVHEDTDQLIRVEGGLAQVVMGDCQENLTFCRRAGCGEAVFVPAGTWHNIINIGNCPLKLSSVYAPPHHPHGTVHRTKCDAQRAE